MSEEEFRRKILFFLSLYTGLERKSYDEYLYLQGFSFAVWVWASSAFNRGVAGIKGGELDTRKGFRTLIEHQRHFNERVEAGEYPEPNEEYKDGINDAIRMFRQVKGRY